MRRVLNSSDFRTLQVASQVLHERREVSVSHRSDLSGQFLQANDGLRFVDFPEVGIAMPGQATIYRPLVLSSASLGCYRRSDHAEIARSTMPMYPRS